MAEYPWSSLSKFRRKDRPKWLEPQTVLLESGELPDSTAGWKRYVQYLEFLATDELAKKELVAERMSRGWGLGDRSFRTEMKKIAAEQGADLERYAGLEPAAAREERATQWEEHLQRLACVAKVGLDKLPPMKSDPSKSLLAAAMKANSSVSNRWLARRLAMGEPASASQFARRWLLQPGHRRDLQTLLSQVKT